MASLLTLLWSGPPDPEHPPVQGGLGQSWFVLEFEAGYDGVESKLAGGATPPGIYGPAFITTDTEWGIKGELVLARIPAPEEIEIAAAGRARLARDRDFRYAGRRPPATRIVLARRDDDEVLLLL